MVFNFMSFIRAVRIANWKLRRSALEDLDNYLLPLDLRNCSAMCTLHVAERKFVSENHSETWLELVSGKLDPNKSDIPLCSLGAGKSSNESPRRHCGDNEKYANT